MLPLKFKSTGVIYVDNRIHRIVHRRERDLLAAFASRAAIAIENARHFKGGPAESADNVFPIASGVITTDGASTCAAARPNDFGQRLQMVTSLLRRCRGWTLSTAMLRG